VNVSISLAPLYARSFDLCLPCPRDCSLFFSPSFSLPPPPFFPLTSRVSRPAPRRKGRSRLCRLLFRCRRFIPRFIFPVVSPPSYLCLFFSFYLPSPFLLIQFDASWVTMLGSLTPFAIPPFSFVVSGWIESLFDSFPSAALSESSFFLCGDFPCIKGRHHPPFLTGL